MGKEKSQLVGELIRQLEQIAQYMQILDENVFKIRAFEKGAAALEATEEPLAAIADGSVKIAGVGEGLRIAISEFLETGRVKALDELGTKVPAAVLELMKVPSLGPKKAMTINSELGVNSISELEYACRENRLLTLKGFGKAIQQKVLSGIESLNARKGKYRIDEAIARADALEASLRKVLGKKAEIIRVGALGRASEIVERLEFCFTGSAENVGDAISSLPWSKTGLSDRRETPFDTELAGFSGEFDDGWLATLWVSEVRPDRHSLRWLCADEAVREIITETPKRFEDWENTWLESEWVDAERRPSAGAYRRERHGSVKGIFHCHTDFSDGAATLEQMVRAAEAKGYEYIGISDHSQSAFYAQGLKPEKLREQREMIVALQKRVSIRIFHGVESDILADGALDYDTDVLEGFDFIVGSIHSRFKMEEGEMTQRLVRAIENPHITIWGHPTGRLILGRKGYSLSWEKCLAAAAKCGVAVELNANPQRLDIDWRLGAELERTQVKVCINPDAHSMEGLDDTALGELMAEKAMVPAGQILNLMNVTDMEKYLWDRKQRRKKRA